MKKVPLFLALSLLSFVFAQENLIRIKLPLDSTGMLIATPNRSEMPVQKLGLSSNRQLNLAELSAKDTASFETYTRRLALVQDSINAMQKEIDNSKKRTASQMPALEPKDEYEKQAEFEERKARRERELGERMIRDYKPYAERLAELEKAKKKIEDNRSALYCTVEINTNPTASIFLNNEEIGTSPAKYDRVVPGNTVIKFQKDNYEPWDTTLILQPAQKLKLSVTLEEKSIFSKEGELNFPKIIARDTTVQGYLLRMERVKARMKQADDEIKIILENFGKVYPPLEPKKPEETEQDFEQRQLIWRDEGIRQVGVLKYKHEAYTNQLVRTLKTLENNIIATESQLIVETPPNAHITLGAYDVEKEIFEFEVQDTAKTKSPFIFVGILGIPRDTAKAMNRSIDGFLIGVSYLNYPFVFKDSSFNLAMKDLAISRKAIPLKLEGGFKPLNRFELMEGYGKWRIHVDSLLSGTLKTNSCLDLDYVIGKKRCEGDGLPTTATAEPYNKPESSDGLSWRGWTRIVTFSAAAIFGTVAIMRHLDAVDYTNKANKETKKMISDPTNSEYPTWEKNRERYKDRSIESSDSKVNFSIGAGVFAVAGALTFVF
ncbi:MAG: PEGA domain-containing protein [Fibromonadaceae bacterium]|jgi:hypothetical protein|nr:PEGA domain-containing protein [Fibromonadaceae bacterium]